MVTKIGTIKRGDTFNYFVNWEGVLLNELSSQVRTESGHLLSEVVILDTLTPDTFQLTVSDTTKWLVGKVFTDVQRTAPDGVIISLPTMEIEVVKDVTIL